MHLITPENKFCLFLLFIFCYCFSALAQNHIQVQGKYITGPCGDTLLLRGINYAPYNWGWSPNQMRVKELAKTKANCVRLVWYKTGEPGTPASTYSNLTLLDSALSQCIKNGLIPIVVLHDQTCQNSPTALINLATWFVQPAVIQIINRYQKNLILNIANEALHVNWTGNPTLARMTFQNTYTTIVNNLRDAGIEVPLMIDGPECGTNLDVLAAVGPLLVAADPVHNIILSAHAYWYSYANNDSSQMETKINNALLSNMAFVFGEIANLQDDASICQYSLNYKALLRICKRKKIGWLAWSWDNDGCAARQVSNAGNFSGLTPYGQAIINDLEFGLAKDTVSRSQYLKPGGCLFTKNDELSENQELRIFPNPCRGKFSFSGLGNFRKLELISVLGESIQDVKVSENGKLHQEITINSKPGIYWLRGDYKHYFKVINLGN